MQVDKMTSFEDFFKLDLIADHDNSDPFSFLSDEYAKDHTSLSLPPPANPSAFDLFAPFDSPTSPSSSSSSLSFAIDPQLVINTPSTLPSASEFGDVDDEEQDLEEGPPLAYLEPEPAPELPKSGKVRSRKGTVLAGGIAKKSVPTNNKENAGPMALKRNAISSVVATGPRKEGDFPDDWRPSPEEYKKMSSKEKRQLRNKISARNFRVRRKEYISTLEADISERDRLLSAVRSELGSTRSENAALRQEVAALKQALLAGRAFVTPATAATASTTASVSTPTTPASVPAPLPAALKDLPSAPRAPSSPPRAFWGGLPSTGFTPVHTALIPELSVGLGLAAWGKAGLMENLNPALNLITPPPSPPQAPMSGFDGFSDSNLFTLKALDAYRLQLWGKMASQQRPQPPAQTPSPLPSPPGLVEKMPPRFFQSHGQGLSGLLSGKSAVSSVSGAPSKTTAMPEPTKEQAALAALASQTLLRRLGGAFWDAFSGASSSASSATSSKGWDVDKVRRVLEGKAVVKVVDVEEMGKGKKDKCALSEMLAESMGGLSLKK